MQFQGKAGTQMIQQQEKGPERNTYTHPIPAGQGKRAQKPHVLVCGYVLPKYILREVQ